MVFSSLVFLYLFLPLNLILYYSTRNATVRNVVLIVFSLLFYAWGEPVWVSLLILSSVCDFFFGKVIERYRGTPFARLGLILSLVTNLGLLAGFKYAGLFVETINQIFRANLQVPGFSLPIGISFYTFQTISYVVDVYRGEVKAQHSFVSFLMFVSLFHKLVAGPIIRYADVAQEISHRSPTLDDFARGITRLCVGLFKKVCIANIAGELVAKTLDGNLDSLPVSEAWLGLLMFTVQIYFDFSGYSDMAIGLGLMFGFHYQENFNYPYIAKTATEFWRRWHISLSTFFRDYLYIPLGGNRHRAYLNLFMVWALTGLWHGASWNFVLWGLYYGLFIALERWFLQKALEHLPAALRHVYLLLVVILGWGLFYFTDLSELLRFFSILFGFAGTSLVGPDLMTMLREHLFWMVLALVLCVPIAPFLRSRLLHLSASADTGVRVFRVLSNVALCLLSTAMLVGKSYNPFLYYGF